MEAPAAQQGRERQRTRPHLSRNRGPGRTPL